MPNTNFKLNGTDLDALFEPIGASSKRADVSYSVNGTDISTVTAMYQYKLHK